MKYKQPFNFFLCVAWWWAIYMWGRVGSCVVAWDVDWDLNAPYGDMADFMMRWWDGPTKAIGLGKSL